MRVAGPALISSATGLLAAYAAPAVSVLPYGRLLFPTIRRTDAKNAVALTFDDGPDLGLETFLGTLEGYGARATFFVVGEQVERDPGRLREILVRGHEVAVHCYRHRNHLRLSPRQTVEDMRRAKGIIEEVSACTTRLFRPPHGVFNLASWTAAPRLGWERVLWTRWGRDWEARATPESIADRIGHPEAGDVLLLHDSDRYAAPGSWRNTLGALPTVLERISTLKLLARPVGELLRFGECY